ncbi:DUF368 domain-containing protein [Roseiconus nitratireducens]|uniref:DUF368 domain-containing protein n=1 Tax=Roseiconus nitratireducens TaxID=2605748 RepID=A0A5M6D3K8_9BACT|nr:DUF368 domain-containing protein [Roseiconus nitratireducens]KAA5541466.1 DUF368 domain-containing protein [Roseiconus nitratireducens]
MMSPENQNTLQERVDRNIGDVSDPSPSDRPGISQDLINALRGFLMGAADTVPGISGGTVALILGHYQRLVTAISRFDHRFLAMVRQGQWQTAWRQIDGRFLMALAIGMATGILALAGLMHWLLDHRLSETYAVFFGLILASVWIVRRYVVRWRMSCVVTCALAVVAAIAIGRLSPASADPSLPYLFVSGAVAICAMILPGISGAFVLLLFGVYHPITGMIKDMVKMDTDLSRLVQMGVFAFGCLFGLLAFSRLLRWLLERHQSVTMAALIGLMLGSLIKLWPLQVPTAETANLDAKERVMELVSPAHWQGSLVMPAVLIVMSAALVLMLERVAGSIADDEP